MGTPLREALNVRGRKIKQFWTYRRLYLAKSASYSENRWRMEHTVNAKNQHE